MPLSCSNLGMLPGQMKSQLMCICTVFFASLTLLSQCEGEQRPELLLCQCEGEQRDVQASLRGPHLLQPREELATLQERGALV